MRGDSGAAPGLSPAAARALAALRKLAPSMLAAAEDLAAGPVRSGRAGRTPSAPRAGGAAIGSIQSALEPICDDELGIPSVNDAAFSQHLLSDSALLPALLRLSAAPTFAPMTVMPSLTDHDDAAELALYCITSRTKALLGAARRQASSGSSSALALPQLGLAADVLWGLLRMGLLQRCSAQAAALAAWERGGARTELTEWWAARVCGFGSLLLVEVPQILRRMLQALDGWSGLPQQQRRQPASQAALRRVRRCFVAAAKALVESQLPEQLARTVLLLALSGHPRAANIGGTQVPSLATHSVCSITVGLKRVVSMLEQLDLGPGVPPLLDAQAIAAVTAAAAGPCLRHLQLSRGLRALAAADGGPGYGIQDKMYGRLTLHRAADFDGDFLQAFPEARGVGQVRVKSALLELVDVLAASSTTTTPTARTGCALLLRVARNALQCVEGFTAPPPAARRQGGAGARTPSGRAAGTAGGSGGGGSGQGGAPPVMLPWDAGSVGYFALQTLRGVLSRRAATAARDGDQEAWWRCAGELVLALCGCPMWRRALDNRDTLAMVQGCVTERDLPRLLLGEELVKGGPFDERGLLLPAAPTPKPLRLALSGGLLRTLEALWRRAGRHMDGFEAMVLQGCWALKAGTSALSQPLLAALLAHGEPGEAAALVVTLGKVLRRVDVQGLAAAVGMLGRPAGMLDSDVGGCTAVSTASQVLFDAYRHGYLNPGLMQQQQGAQGAQQQGAAGGGATAGARYGRQVCLMLHQLLPPLAQLLQQLPLPSPGAAGGGSSGGGGLPRCFGDLPPHMQELLLAGVQQAGGAGPGVCAVLEQQVQWWNSLLGWVRDLTWSCGTSAEANSAYRGRDMWDAFWDVSGMPSVFGAAGAVGGGVGGGGGVVVPAAEGSGPWRELLLQRLGVVQLLGRALRAVPSWADIKTGESFIVIDTLYLCCAGVVRAFPKEVRAALRRQAGGLGAAGVAGRSGGSGRGSAGAPPGAAAAAAAVAAARALWPVAELEGALHRLGLARKAMGLAALRAQLEAWARGEERWVLHNEPQPDDMACVPHGAACEGLLRACSNPSCASLEGDSEAGLQLMRCGGCGAAWYCGGACQRAHWRAGHMRACRGG